MGRLFGTDGVRGLANADLTPELALALSSSAARVLGARRAVVGRDTRASGELLEAAVVAGLASAGCSVGRLGVLPTPGVAFAVGALGADLGVMLSASHNPMPDNGVKFFDASGYKLPDSLEDEVSAAMGADWSRPTGASVGRVVDDAAAVESYVSHLVSTAAPLDGLRVVVDCAHGAASTVAPAALRELGASVTAIAAEPDGLNINESCGSTHPEALVARVLAEGADVGVAHDGDADRCLMVTSTGELVDGDQLLAILAVDRAAPAVVATVMANLGFKRAMASYGIEVVETAVGDRYVLEAMRSRGIALGGEQSGHVILADHSTTGDGVLTALQVLSVMARTGRTLADLASVMERLPQVLVNVRVADKSAALDAARDAVAEAEAELGDEGRVLVRPSGTEPLVRVMVEATSEETARAVAERVAAVVGV
ncbi:MAG TPA: phosphoglucosamine mutase [Frankiaceae bacterium]|nr:phosphoglucosamine mutase [Frankiaceae bacterium]